MPNSEELKGMPEIELTRVQRRLIAQIEEAKDELDGVMLSINSGKAQLEGIERDIATENNKLTSVRKLVDDYSNRKTTLETEIDTLNEDAKKKRKERDAVVEEVKVKEEKRETIDKDLEAKIEENIARENEALAGILKEKEDAILERDQARADTKAAQEETAKINKDNEGLAEKKKYLQDVVTDLTPIADRLKGEVSVLDKQKRDIEDKLMSHEDSLKSAKTDKALVEEEIARLRGQLDQVKLDIKNAEKELDPIEKELADKKLALLNLNNREKHVRGQEAYLIEQFKSAGIAYTPYSE